MTDSGEAFGKDVQQPATDQLMRMQRHDSGFSGATGGPAHQHVAFRVVANEPLGGEGAATDVTGKVAQGGAPAADVLELDIPGLCG